MISNENNSYLSDDVVFEKYGYKIKYGNFSEQTCPICLSNMGKCVKILSCGHMYHAKCINEYAKHCNTIHIACPTCRKEVKNPYPEFVPELADDNCIVNIPNIIIFSPPITILANEEQIYIPNIVYEEIVWPELGWDIHEIRANL